MEGLTAEDFSTENKNYNVTFIVTPGWLKITPADLTVTITGNNDTKEYTGSEQSVTGYTISIPEGATIKEGEINGPEQDAAIAKGTDADGGSNGDKSYPMEGLTADKFSTTNKNYNVTFDVTNGWLKITPANMAGTDPQGNPKIVISNPKNVYYNGEEQIYEITVKNQQNVNLIPDVDFTIQYKSSIDGEFTGEDFTNAGTIQITIEGKGNYYTEKPIVKSYQILPRPVTLVSESATKEFDGKELTKPDVTGWDFNDQNNTGFVTGEVSNVEATGTVTTVAQGQVTNTITYTPTPNGNFKEDNYSITLDKGELRITPRSITVSVADAEDVMYDGELHTGETEYKFENLLDGHTATITYKPAEGRDAGTYEGTFDKDTLKVVFAETGCSGCTQYVDITENYKLVKATPGKLTIKKIGGNDVEPEPGDDAETMDVASKSIEVVYDAEEHTVSGKATKEDSTIEYSTNGGADWSKTAPVRTDVGTTEFSIRATHKNYETVTREGYKLVVKQREITVAAPDAEDVLYDGEPHTGETEYKFDNLVKGHEGTITYTPAKGTNAGDYIGSFGNDLKVMAGKEDVTGNYKLVTETTGKLTITPRAALVTANPATKVYGTDDPEFGAAVSGVIGKDKLEYTVTRPGAGTDEAVGIYRDAVVAAGKKEQGNYTVEYVPADFTITEPGLLNLAVVGYNGTYDAKDHFASATANVMDGTTIEYSTDDGKTWSEDAPSIRNVGRRPFRVRAKNPGYKTVEAEAVLKVAAAKATVTADTASKVFGEEDPGFTARAAGVIDGYKLKYTVTRPGAGTDEAAGTYRKAVIPAGETQQGNYEVTYVEADFTITKAGGNDITPSPDPDDKNETFDAESGSITVTYDGKAHTVSAKADKEGSRIQYSTNGGRTWSDTAPSRTDAGTTAFAIRASHDNFADVVKYGYKLIVNPRELEVVTGSAEKAYDGTPLTNNEESSIKGLVKGETAAVTANGIQTKAGTTANQYAIEWDSAKKEELQGHKGNDRHPDCHQSTCHHHFRRRHKGI